MKTSKLTTVNLQRRQTLALPLLAAYSWGYAQTTPESPASAIAKPDATSFIRKPQMTGALFSPNGLSIAMRVRNSHGRSALAVVDTLTLKSSMVYSFDALDVFSFMWLGEDRLAFTLGDWNWDEDRRWLRSGHGLFVANKDGSGFRRVAGKAFDLNGAIIENWDAQLYGRDSSNHTDSVLMYRLQGVDDDHVADYYQLFRLNVNNKRFTELQIPLHSMRWWLDHEGEIRVALVAHKERGELVWNDPATKTWRVLTRFDRFTEEPDIDVQHIAKDGTLYVTSRRGSDRQTLWTLNPQTGEWSDKPLLTSPHFDIDANVLTRQDQAIGLRFDIDAEVTLWLDPELKALQAQMDEALPQTTNRLSVPERGNSEWVLVTSFADNRPEVYRLFNRSSKRLVQLGAAYPELQIARLARMELVQVKARDGMDIPCWITTPAHLEKGKKPPMVVLVHGGPFTGMPIWEFDTVVQFLAARGYLVLQPQFRGTMGLGQKHHLAGWRQWGKAMQTDVTDATRWAVAQGLADPKRVAIAGGSYGGYSALMGLVQEPTLYCCGLAWAAPTDLDMMYSVTWSDLPDTYKKVGLPKLMGDRVKDAEDLKAHSPLTHASDIKQPLLLVYGKRDRRVPIVHGEKLRKAVQAVNPNLEWVTYEDEGHGWASPKNQIDFWNRVANFLDKHTAPRI